MDRLAASLVLALTAWPLAAGAAVVTETVTYEHEGTTLEGYLAYDDVYQGQRPGVLVVHQWMGLTDYERMRARRLAELGYVALAADVYGEGVRPASTAEAREQAGKFYGDRALFRARLNAGLEQLRSHPLADPDRLAAIGYCFGGGGVLELARSGADLAGVVSFHGSLSTPDPADAENIRGSVLVCHGAADPHVPQEDVVAFVKEMEAAAVDYQLIEYGGAVHAFTQKGAGDDPSRGAAYDAKADRRSWQHMKLFFAEIFDQPGVLLVLTNHGQLGDTGEKTGFYLGEAAHPWHVFREAGFRVTLASPAGGPAPLDPRSEKLDDPVNREFFDRFVEDGAVPGTVALAEVDPGDYDAIFFAGGHGTMWDFPVNPHVARVGDTIYAEGGVVGAVCHGPAALLQLTTPEGEPLVAGRQITSFTNAEESAVELTDAMPFLLETRLREQGATFHGGDNFAETVSRDGRVVTGQNPASAAKAAEEIVTLVQERRAQATATP